MNRAAGGLIAGFVATAALSILMLMKAMMGLMPGLDLPKIISSMMGAPGAPIIGWAAHFMIGVLVYGLALAWLDERLPGQSRVGHGLILAVAGWFIMMVMLMPMAGAGVFGLAMGMMAPVMTLVLHLIFGWVLGATYARLVERAAPPAHPARA
jgi:hypothetical protein